MSSPSLVIRTETKSSSLAILDFPLESLEVFESCRAHLVAQIFSSLRPEGCSAQAGSFFQAAHQVGILHGLAGCAFAEVIDGAKRDDNSSLGVGGVGDESEI